MIKDDRIHHQSQALSIQSGQISCPGTATHIIFLLPSYDSAPSKSIPVDYSISFTSSKLLLSFSSLFAHIKQISAKRNKPIIIKVITKSTHHPTNRKPRYWAGLRSIGNHHSVLYVLHPIERFHDLFLKWV